MIASAELSFRAALLDPERPIPEGLIDAGDRPAGRRYNVYRNNITASLTEALETGFPAVAKLLGEDNFNGVARLYLRAHPPRSARMMHYGADFAEFLEKLEPLQRFPYLGDVARLELLLRESYHSADHVPLPAEAFAVPPDALMNMRFALAPSARMLRSSWPVHALWAFNMAGGPKPEPTAQDVVILRTEFDPEPHALPPGGFAFLSALSEGATLGDAFETALSEAAEFDLSPLLSLLLTTQSLTGRPS